MYPLGRQFEIDYTKAVSDPKVVIQGQYFRISVLTERVVRLEYSSSSQFNDKPTQIIRRRNFSLPDFSVCQDTNMVQITTRYFTLTYIKEQPFIGTKVDPMKNLKITVNSSDRDRCKDWYYGHPEARNLCGNMVSVDMGLPFNFKKGIYSLDGFATIDDSFSKIFDTDGTLIEPMADHTDIYVFMYDRDFKQALFDYFKLTGPPPLIPRYALGNWWSRNTNYDDNKINNLIRHFEKDEIPLSVVLLDHDWHIRDVGNYRGLKVGYTFNNNLIKNPKNMIDEFHKRGIKVGLCINPMEGIYPHETYYQNAAEFLKVTGSTVIEFDPLNPKLLDVLFKMFLHPLESIGVDLFWNDSDGKKDIHKLWALNHYLYLDSARSSEERPLILSRGGVFAPHRYPVLYGGSSEVSWKALKQLPFLYLNSSNAGITWVSHDVGGNHGGIEDGELYVRYLQLSTFCPILRFHAARGKYYKREPWAWDAETKSIAIDYLQLRHRLIPYIYTEGYNYTKAGVPLLQPFYYNYMWVYDDMLYRNQYYFGSQLLICPILDKMDPVMNRTIHRFFMPDGVWYDFVTGKKFPGNKKYISFFKEDDYPVFAHAGSIIPLSNQIDNNYIGLPKDLEIQVFPGASNNYVLYEDDGISTSYKQGQYLKTSIDYNYLKNNYTVILRSIDGKSGIAPEKRNYKIVFRNVKQADKVVVFFNSDKIDYESYVVTNDFVVEVKDVPTIGQLTINCTGKDIEIEAQRLINDDIDSILNDLKIETYTKEKLAEIMFSNMRIQNKRIEVRKLRKAGLSKEYVKLFLKLLEYMNEV